MLWDQEGAHYTRPREPPDIFSSAAVVKAARCATWHTVPVRASQTHSPYLHDAAEVAAGAALKASKEPLQGLQTTLML